MNKDGQVNAQDLLLIIRDWSQSVPTPVSAQETGLSEVSRDQSPNGPVAWPDFASAENSTAAVHSQSADPGLNVIPSPNGPVEERPSRLLEDFIAQTVGTTFDTRSRRQPRVGKSNGGYVDFLSFPSGSGLAIEGVSPEDPEGVALKFLEDWRNALVNESPLIQFRPIRIHNRGSRTLIRFQQTYAGIPIFGAQVTVQVNPAGRITSMLSGLVTDTHILDTGQVGISPIVSVSQARDIALSLASDDSKSNLTASSPKLLFYAPPSRGGSGSIRLAWNTVITGTESGYRDEGILVDAQDGDLVLRYPLVYEALDRDIYDKDGASGNDSGTLERSDSTDPPGSGISGISEVDKAWDFFDSVYSFYYDETGRYGLNDASRTTTASVRSCHNGCDNASWSVGTQQMYFGDGWVADDICGHEYTHGVVYYEVGVIYLLEAGAFGEAMADSWGEWIDQTYTHTGDDDSSASKWLVFEDLSSGAVRDMADPPQYDDADRYRGDNWYNPDNCEEDLSCPPGPYVHTNSGVGNKLCYLLTDGDSHNGFTILATGVANTADLFYEVILNMVHVEDAYHKMYEALISGANTLSFSESEVLNLEKACQSVNIRKNTGQGLFLKDSSGNTVGIIEDSGKPDLKKTLSESQSTITPGDYGIVIKDSAGTVVAYLDGDSGSTGGEMKIKGTLTENTDPPESVDNILEISFEGVNVTTIDDDGNLKIWGELSENVTF